MNADRYLGAWIGAGVLAAGTVAALIPSGWYVAQALSGAGAGWPAGQASHWLHTAALMAACPAIGVLLTLLVKQLAREPVPVAHQVLVLAAAAFVGAVLVTTGEGLWYLSHGGVFGSTGW